MTDHASSQTSSQTSSHTPPQTSSHTPPQTSSHASSHRASARRRLRVLLTRSEEDCAAWAAELERRGIASVSLPCITTEVIDSSDLRQALGASAREADWIVFTSRRGVETYVRLTASEAPRRVHGDGVPPRIAAVGAGTAEAAQRAFGRIDLVGDTGTGESLARALVDALAKHVDTGTERKTEARSDHDTEARSDREAGARRARADDDADPFVLLVLAENAPDTLARALGAAGIRCRRFDVYRTVSAQPQSAKRALASLGIDAVLLASPSAARGFVNQIEIDTRVPLVTIGPTTSAAVRKLGLDVAGQAREPSLDALIDAVPLL